MGPTRWIAFALFACLGVSEAKEHFVSPTGRDTNPGTAALPFATPARAMEAAGEPGDVVTLRGGTYTLTETLRFAASGTPEAPITLRAAAGETAILRAPDAGTDVIEVQASHLLLSNLAVRDGAVGIRIEVSLDEKNLVTSSPSDIRIEGCTVADNHAWAGIQVSAGGGAAHRVQRGRHIVIRRCLIENNGETDHHHGVYAASGDDILVEDCVVRGNSGYGLHFYCGGEEDYPDMRGGGSGIVLRRNRCYGNGATGKGGSGIVIASGESESLTAADALCDVVIENNLCYDNHDYGVLVDYGRPPDVCSTGVIIRNNTCFRNQVGQVRIGLSKGVTLVNNLLSRGGAHADLVEITSGAREWRVDANFYAEPDGNDFMLPGNHGVDFAGWRKDGTRDARGALGSPMFVDEKAPDLHLKPGSQAIRRGAGEAGMFASDDIDGNPRPADRGVDMGAYQTRP